jgi:hypothetical protein
MTLRINDNGTDRDMTKAEIKEYEAWKVIHALEAEAQAQADADRQALKTATLAKLGLTADEVAALLS